MTHLTQVILDFATAARLRLRDSYDWHQAVWKAFPGPRRRATRLPDEARPTPRELPIADRLTHATGATRLVSSGWRNLENETNSGYVFHAQPLCVPALCEPNEESF